MIFELNNLQQYKMEVGNNLHLCRICLKDGAEIPIFESNDNKDCLIVKLSQCLKEKIEDIDGFPRNICNTCSITLETVCNFIQKYRESSKILQSGLLIVKNENVVIDFHNFSDHAPSEVEIEIKDIKAEPNLDYESFDDNECLIDLIRPLQLKIKSKEITIKKAKSSLKKKSSLPKNKTNKVASSLLEGEFTWSGERWCLKSKQLSSPEFQDKTNRAANAGRRPREIKLKLPKIKKPDPPKLCDLCGEVFKTQEKLNLHKKKSHFKNPVTCPKCQKICVSDYYLKRHIKRKHDMEKNFICSSCGRRFAFKGELTSHQRNVHDKHLRPKKVFACKFCDKTYKCAKSIQIHERSVHTGQRPAECTVCGSCFYHEDYLKEHMRLHTGETPFKCPICGRGYAQRGNMKSHLRIHRLAEIDAVTLSKIKPNYLKLLKDFR